MTNRIFKTTNKKELFNMALFGILAQGKPAISEEQQTCVYRDEYDPSVMCGVGHCLTEEAHEIIVGFLGSVDMMVDEVVNNSDIEFDQNDESDLMEFLDRLQQAHDVAESDSREGDLDFIDEFLDHMGRLAQKEFKIKMNKVTGLSTT